MRKNCYRNQNARIENTIRIIKEAQADKERTQSARQELTDFKKSDRRYREKEQGR